MCIQFYIRYRRHLPFFISEILILNALRIYLAPYFINHKIYFLHTHTIDITLNNILIVLSAVAIYKGQTFKSVGCIMSMLLCHSKRTRT